MYQADDPLFGTLPVPSAPQNCYLMWAGSPNVTFGAIEDGVGTYLFPQPFPNGLLCASLNIVSVGPDAYSLEVQNFSTNEILSLYATYDGSPLVGNFHITGIAIGW